MKTKLCFLFIALALLAGINQAAAQFARFFQVVGPTATTITAFHPDGTMVWSNAQPGATYTIQIVSSLSGVSSWVDYVQIPTANSVNSNRIVAFNPPSGMTLIPAGSFTMGNSVGDPGFADAVPISVMVSGFYMDTNLVSFSQWQGIYNWATNQGYVFTYQGAGKAANHPVQTIGWYDAVKWSNARSQLAGLTPVYYTDGGFTQVFTNGDYGTTVYPNWSASGYRLPTEAEWEKAARGGLSGHRYPWGDTISWDQANYYGAPYQGDPTSHTGYLYDLATANGYDPTFATDPTPYTSPVGYFPPNGYGLNDMAGNVLQWCWDAYATAYAGGTDPHGPVGPFVGALLYRVPRGGYWSGDANGPRCASRISYFTVDDAQNAVGFRCVRGL